MARTWRLLRLWLLLVFLSGQLAMLAHAADVDHDQDVPGHVCLLCLAGHDLLGGASPALPTLAVLPAGSLFADAIASSAPRVFVVRRRARAPPPFLT